MVTASRVLRDWAKSLHLPRSSFPPRLTSGKEARYLKQCTDDLYAWQVRNRPSQDSFTLHDGPPYANGSLHIGHALNKILKDIINRSQLARGKNIRYIPGWDCHGLPIELKALRAQQTKQLLGPSEVRAVAAKLARDTMVLQKKEFRDWAVMGDWDNAYTTMDQQYQLQQLSIFKVMIEKGLIYREFKPVHWSPSSKTALAEAELEYDENHESLAAYIKFKIVKHPSVLASLNQNIPLFALIWTTTPWTLPANKAVAVHRDLMYSVIQPWNRDEYLLVAASRIDEILRSAGLERNQTDIVLHDIRGADLAKDAQYVNGLLSELALPQPILHADFVSAASGSGLVHMAPGHGFDDYEVCKSLGIETTVPVDETGHFVAEALPHELGSLHGKYIFTDGNEAVLDLLGQKTSSLNANLVWATHKFVHKYPIDWRTKKPVIIRATAQWFANVESLKHCANTALNHVNFVPATAKTRLQSFVNARSQWCISRQRAWGVPIPALFRIDTKEPTAIMTKESIEHIIGVMQARGIDAWWTDRPDEPAWIPPGIPAGSYQRGKDTLDVWFDSGSSWTILSDGSASPNRADVYLEGSDQHRGWFQSSLLTYVACHTSNELAPYKSLLTHGFTLDKEGRKMSKSIGNVVSPNEIIRGTLIPPVESNRKGKKSPTDCGMGIDALRLWVASSDYTKDIVIGPSVLRSVNGMLHKLRLTFKWLLGVLSDFSGMSGANGTIKQDLSDRIVLQALDLTAFTVREAYGTFEPYKAVAAIMSLVNQDLSSFYFETAKDLLYAGRRQERLITQEVCYTIFESLLVMLAPITPILVAEVVDHASPGLQQLLTQNGHDPFKRVWRLSSSKFDRDPDIFDSNRTWLSRREIAINAARTDPDMLKQSFWLSQLHTAVKAAQEVARTAKQLGSGLDCDVIIRMKSVFPEKLVDQSPFAHFLIRKTISGELARALVVSDVKVILPTESVQDDKPTWSPRQVFTLPEDPFTRHGPQHVIVSVQPPTKAKCPRCWRFVVEKKEALEDSKADESDHLCSRCSLAVAEST